MIPIVDAVTAVICCGDALLMVHRQPFLASFAGFHAFPGGKVDAEDAASGALPACCDGFEPRLMRALLRELQEELALDLSTLPTPPRIRELGLALTPPTVPLRFNTYFYRIDLECQPALRVDLNELSDAGWAPAREWLARYRRGELLLAPPTQWVVQALAADAQNAQVPELVADGGFRRESLPCIEHLAGVRLFDVRSHTLPPATHTNCYLLGDSQSHRILVDPSPCSDEELERLCARIGTVGLHEIFLTHHHPDHHERAPELARRLGAPIGLSEDSHERILARHGRDYFDGITVHHYRDADVVCRWFGDAVRVHAVPGHDEGQLALMPDSRAWCLVGDLIQGIGTVVIAAPEGDMRKYYASLQKLIELDPKVIFPSHGQPLGSTYRLRETLHHRQLREQQVLSLHREGHDIDAMLPLIYAGTDPRLMPLARKNIESHLRKLQEDGVLPH